MSVHRQSVRGLPLLIVAVLLVGLMAQGIMTGGPARADTCPGYTPSVHYEAWLHDVEKIDNNGSATSIIGGDVSTAQSFSLTPGYIIRADLYVCWDGTDVDENPVNTFGVIFNFHDTADPKGTPRAQPDWNSHDQAELTANVRTLVGRFFQVMPPEPSGKHLELLPKIKANDADGGNAGPLLSVTNDNNNPIGTYSGSSASDATCISSPLLIKDAIIDDVEDNQIHKNVDTLHYNSSSHKIVVTLPTDSRLRQPLVGEPITIEGADPSSFDGTWSVSDVTSATSYKLSTGGISPTPSDSSDGTVMRFYTSGDFIPEGTILTGYVEICAPDSGTNTYIGSAKFVPSTPADMVAWDNEGIAVSLAQYGTATYTWYQTLPCEAPSLTGKHLDIVPRLLTSSGYGTNPESNNRAQGPAFTVNLTTTNARNDCA